MGSCAARRQEPRGESSQWGDYHAREAALYVKRLAERRPYSRSSGHRGRHQEHASSPR